MTSTSEPHPSTGQPVGAPVDATPGQHPSPVTLEGRYGRIERLAQRLAAVKAREHQNVLAKRRRQFADSLLL